MSTVFDLSDYVEIQRFLQETESGVTWNEIEKAFEGRYAPGSASTAAARLTMLGFTFAPADDDYFAEPDPDNPGRTIKSMFPRRIIGATDGIDRLRECYAMTRGRGKDSFRKGWSIEDSQRIVNMLATPIQEKK